MNPPDTPPAPLRFMRRGQIVTLGNVPPDRTLLELLREDLNCTAAKEGCASGDCGACTVAVAEKDGDGRLRLRAVKACIRLAHSVEGMAVWTAEDIAAPGSSTLRSRRCCSATVRHAAFARPAL